MNNATEDQIIKTLLPRFKGDKPLDAERKKKMVADEIESANYLKEDWQKEFAKEKILKMLEGATEKPATTSKQKEKSLPVSTIIIFVAGLTFAKILFSYNYKLTISLIVLIIIYLVGFLIGKVVNKKSWQKKPLINFILWITLASWLIPGLGILTSSITLTIKDADFNGKLVRKYKIIGFTGLVLSILSSLSIYFF